MSARKSVTNRANARASTGPKTARGKAHSSQNARRHGLSLSVLADPLLSNEVEALATALVGETARAEIHQLAYRVAAAQIELCRVRWARHQLLFAALNDPDWDSEANHRAKLSAVIRCARTAGPLTPMPDDVVEFVYAQPEGSKKLARILSDKLHELGILDRYERRALSQRKFAIRALGEAGVAWLRTDNNHELSNLRYTLWIADVSVLAERSQIASRFNGCNAKKRRRARHG